MIRTLTVFAALILSSVSVFPQQKSGGDVSSFINTLRSARVIELNFIWDSKSPILSLNPPFAIGLHSSHKQTAGAIPGGIAYAEDMMFFSGQRRSDRAACAWH